MTNYEEPTKISYSQVAKKPAEPTSPESRGDTSPLSFNNIQKALKQPSAATKLSLDDVKVILVPSPSLLIFNHACELFMCAFIIFVGNLQSKF